MALKGGSAECKCRVNVGRFGASIFSWKKFTITTSNPKGSKSKESGKLAVVEEDST